MPVSYTDGSWSREVDSMPVTEETDYQVEALKLYPEKFENYTTGTPFGQWGMCDSNYYLRQAHIKASQLHCNDGLKELIEWIHEKRNVHNYPHFDQILTKAKEIKSSLNK